MTRMSVRVVGLRELRRTLRRAQADMADLKTANAKAAALVAAAARPRSPRKTGRAASTVRGNRAVGRAVVLAGGARAPYVPVIYWGWPARSIPARPWIAETARATEPQWLDAYARDIQAALDKVRGA